MVFIPGKSIVIWIFLERSRGKICSENCEREKERYFSFFFFLDIWSDNHCHSS